MQESTLSEREAGGYPEDAESGACAQHWVGTSLLDSASELPSNSLMQGLLLDISNTGSPSTDQEGAHKSRKQSAAAAKSLQSCPTLCDPIDSSPQGSPVPGILQARVLEWVAISFSNA